MAARQKAIDLAMVIDEDCMELGIERSQIGVATWNDDRRPPLYWAGSDHPTDWNRYVVRVPTLLRG